MDINTLIFEFLRNNRGYLVSYIIFMLAYPLTSVILPKYYGQIADDIKSNKNPKFHVIALLLVITSVMYLVLEHLDTKFIPKLQSYIRINIVRTILENYEDNFEEQEVGILISKLVKLPIVVRDLVRQFRNYVVPLILVFILVIFRFAYIDKRIGLMLIVFMIAGCSIVYPMFKKCMRISSKMDNETDHVHEDISEIFDNLMDIYSSNTIDNELKAMEKRQKQIVKRYRRTFTYTNKLRAVLNGLGIIIFLSVIIYSYKLYERKQIPLSDMINIVVTSMYIISKIGGFAGELPDMVFNLGAYMRTQEFFKNFKDYKSETMTHDFVDGKVVFDNVSIKYGDKNVINNFNLNIEPGESVAILGKIGSGKSSLMKALMKLIPYEGNIYVDYGNVKNINPFSLRSQILYVRQNPLPFNRSLFDIITYGNSAVTRDQVESLFKKYDLYGFFNHDLDASVGKKGGKLSGGQKMVMFLLRVMLQNDKKIVIIDEPTSSLDSDTSKKVMSIIKDVTQKQTTIIITHDESIKEIVKKVIYL